MKINDVLNEGLPGGEYSRVLTALKLYYPEKFSMQELNTPEWHRVIANKADVPTEYAGDVINGFVKASQRNDDDDYNDEQGVAEGLPQTLRKVVPGYAKREIDRKMDAEKFGRTDVDRDANYYRYKKIQDKIKEQGVAEGLNEMDKSAPQPGRDGKVSHSTYGSRDKKGSDYFKGNEAPGKPITKKQMEKDVLDILKKQGVAEGELNEFARGGNGNDDDRGEDPYGRPEPKHYARSVDYFGRFEADHFDEEEFDENTGVFKGYWDDEEGRVQIGYFKFDDPAQTGSDDPGMGWYYEPQNESVAEELAMRHQRDHDTQRRPDISNSLADRDFDMSEVPNVAKSADGHPTVKWRHHGHAGHTRVEPTITPTKVGRLDRDRPIPSFLKKDMEESRPKEKEADYGADYQDMVARVKKLAGMGPLKTVYDPQKRVYKNVPRAEQPKK